MVAVFRRGWFGRLRESSPSRLPSDGEMPHSETSGEVNGAKFDYVDLTQVCLTGVTFRNCSFRGTKFDRSDLSLARFIDCDLYASSWESSVLYTAWFHGCNLTKADFSRAYLLGFRLKDVDITKAKFDLEPLVALERKPRPQPPDRCLIVATFAPLPEPAVALEHMFAGISVGTTGGAVEFIDNTQGDVRFHLRVAETAKYLKRVHAENSYSAAAREYHVVEQRHRRKAMSGSRGKRMRRVLDYVFGDMLWRYGTSILRPLAALFAVAVACSLLVLALPILDPGSGLYSEPNSAAFQWEGWTNCSLKALLESLYFFIVAPTGVASGELLGTARVLFVAYMFFGIALLALFVEASMRRTGGGYE